MMRRRKVWFVCAVCLCGYLYTPLFGGSVIINEIHYNPDVKTEAVEFIELYNKGTNSVDLSGWAFTQGVAFTFPQGTIIQPSGYLVIAQNPSALRSKFGVTALGPWGGKLSSQGETIELRNVQGGIENSVSYKLGFPWPTVGDAPGYSIELINPSLDNDLGGSWRNSGGNVTTPIQNQTLINDHATWRYVKGTQEASNPTTAWRQSVFDDSSWLSGTTPVGYGETFLSTTLSDMLGGYTSVFFRKTFVVSDPAAITSLVVEAQYDDGFKMWINGTKVLDANMSTNEVPYNGTAVTTLENANFVTNILAGPLSYLKPGTNIIAVQAHNISLSGSSDFYFDMRLKASSGGNSGSPTPGARNNVFANNAPPQIRQVEHHSNEPKSNESVRITAKVTAPDGVASVTLQYQIVDPGSYIELTDPAYQTNWTSAAMHDDGIGGDLTANDGEYTVTLPSTLQKHRRLIRYKISASDRIGLSITAPYADDPQPNFAYFVYDGIPGWSAAVQPGTTPVLNFSTNVMRRIQPVHLIAKSNSVATATWFSKYGGDLYQWLGTLVYDGKVYDHVHYRARGGVWRYAMVKNMWKFDLNRGHDFEARDNYGEKYSIGWTKLNLGANIQQADYGHRGEQGMFESVGFRLFSLAGVECPNTAFAQFRVIDDAQEAPPTNQYEGDFWGLYLMVEQEDGRFLGQHNLPDGNFYKMEGGTGTLNNLGAAGPTDRSDLDSFQSIFRNAATADSWWRTNFDLPRYYSYQSIVQGIHHYDICEGKNYFYFRNPTNGMWSVHTWDIDLTWADNMYRSDCGGVDDFRSRVLQHSAFALEYRNRVREVRDLLFNADQAWQVIDEYAYLLRGTNSGPTILDADRSQWDYNPKMVASGYSSASYKAGNGVYYQWPYEPRASKDFNGAIKLMKDYVNYRGTNFLDPSAVDPAIPATPTIAYFGPANFPFTRLSFTCSNYQGTNALASMRWRVAEVTPTNGAAFNPNAPRKYEIESTWDSGEISTFRSNILIPPESVKVGHVYRVRAMFKDVTGRTSHWSAPVEFTAGALGTEDSLMAYLQLSELMYNPPGGDAYEYIELHNSSTNVPLDLGGVKFTSGIDFTFPVGSGIAPNDYLLVVRASQSNNFEAFRAYYKLSPSVNIIGSYSGSLSDSGEKLTLSVGGGGADIFSFTYSDGRGWPIAADRGGHSLIPKYPASVSSSSMNPATGFLDYGGNWSASPYIGGSPGRADLLIPSPQLLINEIMAHTDFMSELDSNDWIELYNADLDFTFGPGWYLSDDISNLKKWMIPTNTVIGGKSWVSFDEVTGFHTTTNGFGLNKGGDDVYLSYLPGNGQDRVVDAVRFKGQENNVSWGRYPDGGAYWGALSPITRNHANSPPVSSLKISEVSFSPPVAGTTSTSSSLEFIELYNLTSQSIALYNTNGVWRLDGGVGFYFPSGTILNAGAYALVLNFNPTNTTTLNDFRNAYSANLNGVSLFGPFSGNLNNRGDRVAIEKPQAPDLPGETVSWIIVDEVIYGNQTPWPVADLNTNISLQRIDMNRNGNDPANWIAAAATVGAKTGGITNTANLRFLPLNNPNGDTVTLQLTGNAPGQIVLQYSGDLKSWTPLATNQLSGGNWTLNVSNTHAAGPTFYRAVTVP